MEDGYFAKHLNKMRKIYKRKLEIITKTIAEYEPIVTISGEQAGMHLLLTISTSKSEDELVLLAKQAGIRVYGLQEYVTGELDIATYPKIVLGFGGIEVEIINDAITRSHECLEITKNTENSI